LIGFGDAQNNLSLMFSKANLPVVQMKVRTNINNATNDIVWGLMGQATAPTVNDTLPTNGIFFWPNNGTSWVGVVRSGGANVGTVTCSGTISTTQFAVGRIQVESATAVRFLMDYDASDGITFTDCGTVSGANPTAALGIGLYNVHTEVTGGRTIDVDYMRAWQDDPVPVGLSSTSSVDTVPIIAEDALTQYADNGELVNGTELIDRVSHESEKDVVSSFTERIKKNVDIISEFVATRVIAIRGYFDTIFAKKIHTQELCLDDVCITKTELQSLLQNRSTTRRGHGRHVLPPRLSLEGLHYYMSQRKL
jgi:hypothetical protein